MAGQRLTGEDFEHLVRYFTDEAFRLEVQPTYMVDGERDQLREFLAGRPVPPDTTPYLRAWLDQIHTATSVGKRVQRVRVLDEPPTDYQRWERWVGRWNKAAGEDIRYLSRTEASAIQLPIDYDWWLFDSARLAIMKFDPDGRPMGGEIITDPAVVAQHRAWRDLAVRHSVPDQTARAA